MANRQVIFVQGEKKNEAKFAWMFFHFDPFSDLDPGPVDLVYFDYPAGTRKTWRNWDKKRGNAPTAAPDAEDELAPKATVLLPDGSEGPEKPSILALYDYVKAQPKESVRSLQVFSHGWMGGPIIWNTREFEDDAAARGAFAHARDPHDTEPRVRDFFGGNPLAGAEGVKFAESFTSDALIKLWGCVAPDGVRGHLRSYFGITDGPAGDEARRMSLKNYLDLVWASYPMQFAHRLNLSVWASPLGYGSEPGTIVPTRYDGSGNVSRSLNVSYKGTWPPDLKAHQWWRVSWFFRNQDQGARYYEKVLGARIDPSDFVEHRKGWFDEANRRTKPEPLGLRPTAQDRMDDAMSRLHNILPGRWSDRDL